MHLDWRTSTHFRQSEKQKIRSIFIALAKKCNLMQGETHIIKKNIEEFTSGHAFLINFLNQNNMCHRSMRNLDIDCLSKKNGEKKRRTTKLIIEKVNQINFNKKKFCCENHWPVVELIQRIGISSVKMLIFSIECNATAMRRNAFFSSCTCIAGIAFDIEGYWSSSSLLLSSSACITLICTHIAHIQRMQRTDVLAKLPAMQQALFARMPNIPVGAITSIHLLFPRLIRFPASFFACIESACVCIAPDALANTNVFAAALKVKIEKKIHWKTRLAQKERFAFECTHTRAHRKRK